MTDCRRFIRRALFAIAAFAALEAFLLHSLDLEDELYRQRMEALEPYIEQARAAEEERAAREAFEAAKAAGLVEE